MKKLTYAFAPIAALALAACGSAENADQAVTADTVEMPAEEAMTDATGLPMDLATGVATAVATDSAPGVDATGVATATAAATVAP